MTYSRLYTAKEICERALRLIRVVSPHDSAAPKEYLEESLHWLDLLVAQIVGTNKCFWLVPAVLRMPLTAGTQSYDLLTTLGTNAPSEGIQFPFQAAIEDNNGNVTEIPLVTRAVLEGQADPDQTGTPTMVWIDRLQSPTLKTYPTLPTTAVGTWYIRLVVQTYAKQFAPVTLAGGAGLGNFETKLRAAWQRAIVFLLGADIGSGPIRTLPRTEREDFRNQGNAALTLLVARENDEYDTTAPITEYRDF